MKIDNFIRNGWNLDMFYCNRWIVNFIGFVIVLIRKEKWPELVLHE